MTRARALAIMAVAAAAMIFIALNVVANAWLRPLRFDMTAGGAFTVSNEIRAVFERIKEPIIVRVYYSEAIGRISTRHGELFQRVRDLLGQYAAMAGGHIQLEFYNPEPFSDVEDRAVGFGLQPIPLGDANEVGYFGLAATNSTDDQQVIPFFNIEREAFLEYDLTKLVYALSEPEQPRIGLISSLPIAGGISPQAMGAAPTPPWAVMQQVNELFTVQPLQADVVAIPADIDLLMLVQPEGLTEPTQYAIDQFVMRGGKVLLFVDPHPESTQVMGSGQSDLTGISRVMAAWGIRMAESQVVGDREAAARVRLEVEGRPVSSDYVAWLQLRQTSLDRQDAITGSLTQVNLGTAGALEKIDGTAATLSPLMTTGLESMRIGADKFIALPDVVGLFRDFHPQGKREVLAARIGGTAKSAFSGAPGGSNAATHLGETQRPLQIVVVADTDILADRFWTQTSAFLGRNVALPTADNGTFVTNAIENLTGSPALSSLRARRTQDRPLDFLDSLRRDAEVQYRASEQALTARLDELQKKIGAMQVRDNGGGEAVLSDEDRRVIETYRADILETRRQLREVQRALRQNLDTVRRVVTFLNIGAVPILFGMGIVITSLIRRRRRTRAEEGHA